MISNNFIKPLPKGENAAVDESLLWLQIRIRKGTSWEQALRDFIEKEGAEKKESLTSDSLRNDAVELVRESRNAEADKDIEIVFGFQDSDILRKDEAC